MYATRCNGDVLLALLWLLPFPVDVVVFLEDDRDREIEVDMDVDFGRFEVEGESGGRRVLEALVNTVEEDANL